MGDGDGDVIGGKDVLIERERTVFFIFYQPSPLTS